MSAQANVAPIIIKRKKVSGGDGHHGGAWKVAYADFVTAMMAFFLLMWLLNATTEKQRKGIADYFNPTVPINRVSGGGEGMFAGESIFGNSQLVKNGTGGVPAILSNQSELRAQTPGAEAQEDEMALSGQRGDIGPGEAPADPEATAEVGFTRVEDLLLGNGGESLIQENALKHVVTRRTDEGLVIELFATPETPLFAERDDTPFPILVDLARMIVEAAARIDNGIAVEGHVASEPVVLARPRAWSLSAARADQFRRLLESHGMPGSRIRRVTGHADRELSSREPLAVRNNRLEIILLRNAL